MICPANDELFRWVDRVPISLTELKSILAKLTSKEAMKLSTSTSTNAQHRTKPLIKKQSRQVPAQSQLYGDAVINSFLVSSSSSAVRISRQGILNENLGARRNQRCLDLDVPDAFVPPKRYASSFRTLVHPTTTKQTQRLNYINDSVVIFKLSKEQSNNSSIVNSQVSSKPVSLSPAASVKIPPAASPIRLSPMLKIEGQIIPPPTILSGSSNQMATSTTNHHQSHPSVFTYRSAAAGGNTVRQRAIADPPSNSLLITAERFKTTMTSTMRSTRQQSLPLTTATTTSYVPSQQVHRSLPQTNRSRVQLDKLKTSQDNYEYADPYTNCPPELLNKLSHLTKLQLETIEWEKRKRFTKKKPTSNAFLQGKDSP
ncbi:unnamed protein product [Adineta ricciae]|uniref:Uncharacterized protein n=1 Tax=Adineta ricciae TaxID=249248 RepID=A0A814XPL4_ADIRI|nr:unnamed protein product [Adineta ricciae]